MPLKRTKWIQLSMFGIPCPSQHWGSLLENKLQLWFTKQRNWIMMKTTFSWGSSTTRRKEHGYIEPFPKRFLSLLLLMQVFVNKVISWPDRSPYGLKLIAEYTAIVPFLVRLVWTLHVEIEEHEKTVDSLHTRISSLIPQESYTYQGLTGHATQQSTESMTTSEQTGKKESVETMMTPKTSKRESQDDDDGDVSLNSMP